jgi:hypothetical protein
MESQSHREDGGMSGRKRKVKGKKNSCAQFCSSKATLFLTKDA